MATVLKTVDEKSSVSSNLTVSAKVNVKYYISRRLCGLLCDAILEIS